jgi:hypothetical protein
VCYPSNTLGIPEESTNTKRIMSDTQETDRVRFSQVLAGALAAVTAALIGSTMGVAGTVVGAGVASVISTIGGTLYLRSIQRTKDSVRVVRAKVVGRSGGATVLVTDDPEQKAATGEQVEVATTEPSEEPPEASEPVAAPEPTELLDDRPPSNRRRLRWPVLVVTTLAAFALGMLAITGVEWLRGESLSGDSGTTFGSIVTPHPNTDGDSNDNDDPTTPTTSTTTPTPTTTTPNPTTTTDPTTTSTTPPSDSSTTTTTTTAPPTTTTTEEAPASSGP